MIYGITGFAIGFILGVLFSLISLLTAIYLSKTKYSPERIVSVMQRQLNPGRIMEAKTDVELARAEKLSKSDGSVPLEELI